MRDARVVRQRRASSTAVCECKATATAKVLKDNPNEMIQLKGHVPSCPLEDNARHLFSSVSPSIWAWRRSSFPPSLNTLYEMADQLQSAANDRLFGHQTGTLQRRVIIDADDCRHFAFYDREIIEHIAPHIEILMFDCTYKTCPKVENIRDQLGTFMAIYRGHALPVAWFIMTRKTGNAYRKVASVMGELLTNRNIRAIVTEYELALRNALRAEFNRANIVGCFFHFIRAKDNRDPEYDEELFRELVPNELFRMEENEPGAAVAAIPEAMEAIEVPAPPVAVVPVPGLFDPSRPNMPNYI
ncbi:hypothetical protein TKK_0015309 [Trichogramma kaykai]